MALALPADGFLVACDTSREWTAVAQRYWRDAGVADRIRLRLAPASETIAALASESGEGSFDLVFIDADKEAYRAYYEAALTLLRLGGLILVDNTLWSGRVADDGARDADTCALRAFNDALLQDPRVDLSLLPVGDGLTLARKREAAG